MKEVIISILGVCIALYFAWGTPSEIYQDIRDFLDNRNAKKSGKDEPEIAPDDWHYWKLRIENDQLERWWVQLVPGGILLLLWLYLLLSADEYVINASYIIMAILLPVVVAVLAYTSYRRYTEFSQCKEKYDEARRTAGLN